MKRLLLILMLWPALSVAQDYRTLPIVGGSMTEYPELSSPELNIYGAGALFTITGSLPVTYQDYFLPLPVYPGLNNLSFTQTWVNGDGAAVPSMLITVGGVQYSFEGYPQPGASIAVNMPAITISGPGTFTLPFTFLADFTVWAGASNPYYPQCDCTYFSVPGAGTATFTIVPDSQILGAFDIDQINYTFNQSVPTPSTASLMLLSLVLLAGMGRKRASAAR
jgi:hypothetical protein